MIIRKVFEIKIRDCDEDIYNTEEFIDWMDTEDIYDVISWTFSNCDVNQYTEIIENNVNS